MAILLVLCVGAVSAADATDMATGGMADIAVSPVSEDVSVLADGEDPDDIRINSSDENQTNITISVNPNSTFMPEDKVITFEVNVLNNSEPITFTQDDLCVTVVYNDGTKTTEARNLTNDEYTLTGNAISFTIPDNETAVSGFVYVQYKPDEDKIVEFAIKRVINVTIEVPESIYVDIENKTGNFNIKVLDVNESMNFTNEDLVIKYIGDNTVIQFIANETLFKEGTYDVINESGTIYIRVGNETYPVSVFTTLKEVTEEIPGEDNQTVNVTVNKTVYYPVAYTLKDGVISFRMPGNDSASQLLNVVYRNGTVTPIESESNITLKMVTGNNINVEQIIELDVNKTISFEINVTDKNGNLIFISQEDFELYMICYGVNLTSEQLKINNFTFVPSAYDEYVDNETNETIIENVTVARISFVLPDEFLGNNYTDAKLNITYKNNDIEEAFANREVAFIDIIVLDTQSETEYQNNYFVIRVWDNYNNVAYANKTVKTVMSKTIFGENIGSTFTTDKDGYVVQSNGKKLTADFLYGFGGYFIPVGTGYSVNVYPVDYIAQAHHIAFNITKVSAVITPKKYSDYYATGNKFKFSVKNSKSKTVIQYAKLILKVYSGKKLIGTYDVYTGTDGIANIGVNLGAGTYTVKISGNDSENFNASDVSSTITVKKITAKITASKTTAYYKCGSKFKVKMVNAKTGKALIGATVLLNVYTGSKFKAVQIVTDENGIAYWKVDGISIGTHRVLIGSGSTGADANVVQTYIYLKKGKTTVTAPVVKNTYKKTQYFNVTVKNAGTKKAISGIVLTIKVYTGKKYKTYTVKTNSKGVATLSTKALSKGTHYVSISSSSKYFTVSKSGKLIVIK